jgi:uncharacterized membrane protein (UPF0127 family)
MITNKTSGQVISKKERCAKNIFTQALGLMFTWKKQNLVMKFSRGKRISLHNCFVFYPLEVIVLDTEMKVVEVKQKFKPFTLFWKSKEKGVYLLELGLDSSKRLCEIGDFVEVN